MAYVCMLSFAMVFQSIPPLLTLVREEFGIGHAQAGLLMSLFALPGIFIGLPSGIISDRFGVRKTGLTSLLLLIVGTLVVATGQVPLQAYIGRIICGVGGLTLAIVLSQLLSKWFLGKELGFGMGVFNTAMPLGTILSFNLLSIVGRDFGWRTPIFLTTVISVIALLFFLGLFKEPFEKEKPKADVLSCIFKLDPSIWLLSTSWMWFNAAFISFLTFASDFLVHERGHELGFAGFLSSIVMMGSLILSPLIGYFVYRFGRENLLIGVGGIFLAFLIFLIPTPLSTLFLLVLIGVFTALVPAPIFSLPSKMAKPQNLGLVFGIMTTFSNVGVLAGPYLVGLARDFTGEYVLSFHLMALFAMLQTVTIVLVSLPKFSKENSEFRLL